MRGQVRWLLFIYATLFALLSVNFVQDDLEKGDRLPFVAVEAATFALINLGNFIYALRLPSGWMVCPWRVLAPYFGLYFLLIGVLWQYKSGHTHLRIDVFLWFFGVLLFAPAYWANRQIARDRCYAVSLH